MTVFAQNTVQMESVFMMNQPTVLKTGTLPTKHLRVVGTGTLVHSFGSMNLSPMICYFSSGWQC